MNDQDLANNDLSIEQAAAILRPSAGQLAAAWKAVVIADRLQVEQIMPETPAPAGSPLAGDFYRPIAATFRGQADAQNDPVIEHLRGLVWPDETWLDLGGGRYAIPISRHLKHVIAVEPSEGMRQVLSDSMTDSEIENIEIFPERWPGPSATPIADVGMIANVSYDIEEIGPFLDQLEAHSRRLCIAILFDRSPPAYFAPLWPYVHSEQRILLPGAAELIALLVARGAVPEVQLLDPPPRTFPDLDTIHQQARRPLWVLEGSEADKRLGEAVREIAIEVEGGFTLPDRGRQLAILTWAPNPAAASGS